MWGFIAFIVLVAIIFGVSLHQAFWGIVGVGAVLLGIAWMCLTDSGRKFIVWALAIIGVGIGAFMCYNGIQKIASNDKVYNNDIYSCEHDEWRYMSAKVYINGYRDYSYDKNKVNAIGDKCVQDAANNKKLRENWWFIEAGAGAMIACCSVSLPSEMKKSKESQTKQQPKNNRR